LLAHKLTENIVEIGVGTSKGVRVAVGKGAMAVLLLLLLRGSASDAGFTVAVVRGALFLIA
jgi:hypothetical protein